MIRNATSGDREKLIRCFYLLLCEAVEEGWGSSMAATEENAATFYDLMLKPGVDRGDPVLIAQDDRGKWLGVCFYTLTMMPWTLVGRIASGHGTWVRRNHRKQGISKALRAEAERQLKEKGIQIIEGAIHVQNAIGIHVAAQAGYYEHAKVVRKLLVDPVATELPFGDPEAV